MEYLRPNEQRAKAAIVLIWIVLGVKMLSLISSYFQYDLFTSVKNGFEVSKNAEYANIIREAAVLLLYFLVYLISGITFIMWFRRAYYNVHVKISNLAHTDGWASGAWFIPIVSLYMPYQIMKEIYVETRELLISRGLLEEGELNTSTLGWWWTLWIINNIVDQIGFRMARGVDATIDAKITATTVTMVSDLVMIPLALITIKVIKDYSRVEQLLHQVTEEEEGETTDAGSYAY